MARVLLTAAPWTYRQIRFADGQDSWKEFMGKHFFKRESTINGKMPFWSLLALASWLRDRGHPVHYVESYGTPEDVWFRELEVFRPDVLGINTVTCTWPYTKEVLAKVKARRLPQEEESVNPRSRAAVRAARERKPDEIRQ